MTPPSQTARIYAEDRLREVTADLDLPEDEGQARERQALAAAGLTEDALASEFTRRHGEDLRHVAEWGKWLSWGGTRWRFDRTHRVFDLARAVCRESARRLDNAKLRARIASAQTVANIVRLAMSDRAHARASEEWDADPWALNTPGGTVDLETGDLRPHRRSDGITKSTTATPGGTCPTWEAGLRRWTDDDSELIAFLQRLVGYSLTGSTIEQVFAFLWGTGGNGKGCFLNTLTAILGDYATTAPMDTFTAATGERHPTDLAMLRGARVVTAQETADGRRWDEARVKALTGGDPISARFMRQDYFTFVPQFTLIVAGNHKPGLRSVDEAMRRRLLLVPFNVCIPPEELDKGFGEKLRAEAPGILAWAVCGCMEWQGNGLRPPQGVLTATDDYFADQDAVGRWLADCCVLAPNLSATKAEVHASWKAWAEAAGEYVLSQRRLLEELERRRLNLDEARVGKNRDRTLIGVGLRVSA